jgi:hypothetical protein
MIVEGEQVKSPPGNSLCKLDSGQFCSFDSPSIWSSCYEFRRRIGNISKDCTHGILFLGVSGNKVGIGKGHGVFAFSSSFAMGQLYCTYRLWVHVAILTVLSNIRARVSCEIEIERAGGGAEQVCPFPLFLSLLLAAWSDLFVLVLWSCHVCS